METKTEPVLPASNNKKGGSKARRVSISLLAIGFFLLGFYVYDNVRKQQIYENLNISFSDIKEIEYGTANYDPLSLVKDTNGGEIVSYTENIDTSVLGTKELVFEISNGDIVKEFKINVEVKDSNAPTIKLKNEEVTITQGDSYDLQSNVESVNDIVDGDVLYSKEDGLANTAYYTISSDFDNNKPGEYAVTLKAYDSVGNTNQASYKVKVNEKPKVVEQIIPEVKYSNAPSTVDTSSVVSAAYSLIGSKYTYGGTNPSTGFDCSGFVQYIYGAVGKSISRSSGTQINDGSAVSKDNMQPGDIIIWSTQSNNRPTHSSVYVGDNTIVHAINSSRGVQKSTVTGWEHTGSHIVGIRRV